MQCPPPRSWLFVLSFLVLACRPPQPAPTADLGASAGESSSAHATQLWREAEQVLDRRCVVCHGCYDAPCQLQLGSFEGIARGASPKQVYEGSRLVAVQPTRLFVDAHSTSAWRDKGFHPVLPEGQSPPRQSLIARMLQLKRDHPMPAALQVSEQDFDLALDRDQVCAEQDDFDDFADEHPLWGMPYALPGLVESEHAALMAWLMAGAPHAVEPDLSQAHQGTIAQWEAFLNDGSKKTQLFARYIYEHLFLASLFFQDVDESTFFRLVRSRTPPGQAIDEISTRRPFDDPESARVYYRFARRLGQPLIKTHMPYALSARRLERYRQLFEQPAYQVDKLPGYDPELASNPFRVFKQIPVRSRYRFMLEEAEFTMMGFIKGPVCRGQIALNVIEDRFWIAFVNPDAPWLDEEAKFLEKVDADLDMPASAGSNAGALHWFKLARKQRKYLEGKSKFLNGVAAKGAPVGLSGVWDGDDDNANAALTVLRHYDSASVVKGFVGGPSKTTWIVGYALLERIHYLLVAGFDVFGNVGHQLTTRMYMDFLRMEAEYNFLLLLPDQRRRELVELWYRNVDQDVKDQVYGQIASFAHAPVLKYQSKQPELELARMLEQHTQRVRARHHDLSQVEPSSLREPLERLSRLVGKPASLFAEISFLAIEGRSGAMQHVSLLRESSHTNVAELFREDARRVTQEDRLTVVNGFLGAYPDALFLVAREELSAFVTMAENMASDADYLALRERFGVLRAHPSFWSHADRIHDDAHRLDPLRAGLFDFNRLDGE